MQITYNTPSAAAREETMRRVDRCCSLYYVSMGSIYNIAQSAMVDAQAVVMQYPDIYRHAVKHDLRAAMQAYDKWDRRMRDTLKERYQLWLDLSDAVDDEMRRHLHILRLAFDAWLLKYGVPRHEVLSHLETALTLITFARQTYDTLFDGFRTTTGLDLRPMFRGGDFRDVEFYWRRATAPLLTTPTGSPDINFNDSPDVRLAFDIISRKLTNEQVFNRASTAALRLNPDMWDSLPAADRKFLEEEFAQT